MLSHSSLVGSGFFEVDTSEGLESYGTINGTGIFSGTGDFSGPMVQAGTFHLRGMIPGDYAITAIWEMGQESMWAKSSLLAPHKAPGLRKSTSPGM